MKLRTFLAVSAALLAAACGSSSKKSTPAAAHNVSYTGPTGAVSITTPAQAAATASGTYNSLGQVSSVGDFTSVMGVSAPSTLTVLDVARLAVSAGQKLPAAADQVSGTTRSGSDNCAVSGTISGSITAADIDYPFRASGDTGSITFSQCNDGTGEVIDGSVSVTINASNGVDFLNDAPSSLTTGYAYAATLAFTDLSIATANGGWMGMEGNITMGVAKRVSPYQIEHSISGTGLAYVVGQGTSILAGSLLTGPNGSDTYLEKVVTQFSDGTFYTEVADLSTVNGKVCSIAMGGCVQVVTLVPVYDASGASHPSDGTFVITSGNAKIVFDVVDATNVNVGYDLNTLVDPPGLTTTTVTWTCLDANSCTFNNPP